MATVPGSARATTVDAEIWGLVGAEDRAALGRAVSVGSGVDGGGGWPSPVGAGVGMGASTTVDPNPGVGSTVSAHPAHTIAQAVTSRTLRHIVCRPAAGGTDDISRR